MALLIIACLHFRLDVIKYFGFELGAQTNIDPSDDRWIVNGAHEASKLQDYLDGFISKFVLCKKCKNPETDVHIKDGNITLDCKACGQRSDVDLRLKLSGFIIKHAPKKGKKDKSTKKADRKAKKEAQAKNGENGENGAGSDDGSPDNGSNNSDNGEENGEVELDAGSDDELTRRINAEAKDLADNEEEVKWTIDVSEEATKARAKQLPDDLKKQLALDDDEEGGEGDDNPYSQLGAWVESQAKEKGDIAKLDDVEIYKKAAELGIEKKHRTLTVLAQTLFDENIVKQITPRAAMLKKMITSDRHEKALLGGTERLIGMTHPDLIPALPKILMQYYENDLASEETLTAWGSKASKKYVDISISRKVRKAAVPFITWLETAESDDDDSE
ncbi:hypothetical protein FH972_023712 [Carpinus fangiana]|uniref:W2 domain-containing protein n=1 Tax=Carpinus fangiana TaxID=176857 RepID=A0A5N6KWH5_9ROSI|nr:hypothetical protein FH972_023712 [Carpinus fangiana]